MSIKVGRGKLDRDADRRDTRLCGVIRFVEVEL